MLRALRVSAPDFAATPDFAVAADLTAAAGFIAAPGFTGAPDLIWAATTSSSELIARLDTKTTAERNIPLCMVILPTNLKSLPINLNSM
jgi:hypothetical protein